MTFIQAIVAGIVQGITEFLPISSSGHLIIMREFFGIEMESLSFDVALHIATLVAVVWVLGKLGSYFRSVVCRAIVDDEHFNIFVGLVERALDSLSQILFFVISCNYDTDFRHEIGFLLFA